MSKMRKQRQAQVERQRHRRNAAIGFTVLALVIAVGGYVYHTKLRPADLVPSQAGQTQPKGGHSVFDVPVHGEASIVDRRAEKVDPNKDGWETEVVTAAVGRQLARLKQYVERWPESDDRMLQEILADEFEGQHLRPKSLKTVFHDDHFHVRRPPGGDEANTARPGRFRELIRHFLGAQTTFQVIRCSFKIVGISLSESSCRTDVLVEVVTQTEHAFMTQMNANWQCTWDYSPMPSTARPRLRTIESRQFEQVSLHADGMPLYEDVTASAIGSTESYQKQVLRGIGYWNERLTVVDNMHLHGHHGLAVGDVNGDGLDDVYVCDAGGLPNRLYLQQGDGTAVDVSAGSGVDWLESSTSALLIDLDNDGDQDLVVATVGGIIFALNDGLGHFTMKRIVTGFFGLHSMCAADYDNDGDLDVYVCSFGQGAQANRKRGYEASVPMPFNDANNGGKNGLLKNEGQFFSDATELCGLDENNHRWSFAASWEDYDNDGDVDLYVANDYGRNNLYRNEDGHFRDVAAEMGVQDMASGMSVAWADFNRDGRMDLYVGNMYSAAGNRVAYQRQFGDDKPAAVISGIQRMARGNSLFAADADGAFVDVSVSAAVNMGRWAWGSTFADLNNDGWQDLIVANGFFTNDKPDDL